MRTNVDWLLVDKTSATGSNTITFTAASENTGRNDRQCTAEFNSVGSDPVRLTIKQKGHNIFTLKQDTFSNLSGNTDVNIKVEGTTNLEKFFLLTDPGDSLQGITLLNTTGTYSGVTVTPTTMQLIEGTKNQGATAAYDFSFTLKIPKNQTNAYKSCTIALYKGATTDSNPEQIPVSLEITQLKYSSSLSVGGDNVVNNTVTLDYGLNSNKEVTVTTGSTSDTWDVTFS